MISNGLTNDPSNFLVGKGYMAAYDEATTKSFTGKLNLADVAISSLTRAGGGWFLLGNPFACALTWDASTDWGLTNVNGIAKIWNEAYQSYSDLTSSPSSVIPATNGFMVRVNQGTTGSLALPLSKRVHSAQPFYKSAIPGLKLVVYNTAMGNAQESSLYFNPEATDGFDAMLDGVFLPGYGPTFYSTAGTTKLSTNSLPELTTQTEIPYVFTANNGSSSFRMEAKGVQTIPGVVWLLDKKNNSEHNLTLNPVYDFTASADDDANRFLVHFISVGIGERDAVAPPVSVFSYGKTISIRSNDHSLLDGSVYVYNMIGQMMISQPLNRVDNAVVNFEGATGFYLLKVMTKSGIYNAKVYIR